MRPGAGPAGDRPYVMPTSTRSIVVVAALLLPACDKHAAAPAPSSKATVSPATRRALTAEERRAVEIARSAVAANDDWADRATFEPKRDGDGWTVYVERQPAVLGGHRLVRVNRDGKVVEYIRGR